MPTNCSVRGCAGSGVNKSYFTLPAVFKFKQCPAEKAELSKQRRQLWLEALGLRDDEATYKIRVCSDHFLTGRPAALEDSNNIDWVPSLHMHLPTILPNRKRKVTPNTQSTRILVNKNATAKNIRSPGLRRSDQKKILNCKVLLDGNLRCTSFNGTNGSGLTIIQKYGKFTSDNVTLRETAINNTVLRVRLIRENLLHLRKSYNISNNYKGVSAFEKRTNRKSSSFNFDPEYSKAFDTAAYAVRPVMRQKQRFATRNTHNTSNSIQNLKDASPPASHSKLRKLLMSNLPPSKTKTLNRVIRKNDKEKIRVKFFPKTSTPMQRTVKNGTIRNASDHAVDTHQETLFVNQYKNSLMSPMAEPVVDLDTTYFLKMGPSRTLQECLLEYPFQKLVMDVKHMKLPGPSWKIKVIIRQGKIAALTFTNKQVLERSVAFTANSSKFDIVVDNVSILLLGAPRTLRSVEDVETLLDIVETIDPKSCMLLHK